MNYTHDIPLVGKRVRCEQCFGKGITMDYLVTPARVIVCPSCDGYGEVIVAGVDRTQGGKLAQLPCCLPKPKDDDPPRQKETVKA